jgi:predicted RNA binding protein YcfA (HicA-like mRNA interferase family)
VFFRKYLGDELFLLLRKLAMNKDRQKGSHIIMRQIAEPHRRQVIPDHKVVAKGTLRAIIKQCGLTVDEFLFLL